MVKRNFPRLDTASFNIIYKGYLRPHLEFCAQAWSRTLEKDKLVLEKVQRRANKLVCGLKNKSYSDRLRIILGLTTLEAKRLRGDLIETYKIVHRKEDIDHHQFLNLCWMVMNCGGMNWNCLISTADWTSGNISFPKETLMHFHICCGCYINQLTQEKFGWILERHRH